MLPSLVYVGMDIAKATLDLQALSTPYPQSRQFANTPVGHRALVRWLRALGPTHVVCEASGGYERSVVSALQQAASAVSVVNPRQVRDFARDKVAWPKPIDWMPPYWRSSVSIYNQHRHRL